ncbi:MAG: DUF2934 domain-containing protein [Devosia sp.]
MTANGSFAVNEATIREQAYYLWERDGRPHGRDVEFWDRAVAELRTLSARTGAAPGHTAGAGGATPITKAPRAKKPSPAGDTPKKSRAKKTA